MWFQSLCACLCESYRDLDTALAGGGGGAGDARPGGDAEAPGALIARMREIADEFPPPPRRMREMDLIAAELCCPRTHARAVGDHLGACRQLLDRCRLPLCQAHLMLCGRTKKDILVSFRSVSGRDITSDGAISITLVVSGVERRCLTDPEDPGKPWRVVSEHMTSEACGLGWVVQALEGAARACGAPPCDAGGILSAEDVVRAMHTNWPRSMPSIADASTLEDAAVLAVHWMLVGVAMDVARGHARSVDAGAGTPGRAVIATMSIQVSLAAGAGTPERAVIATTSIQEKIVAPTPEGDNSFSPWRGVRVSIPLRDGGGVQIADMHSFRIWHGREHVPEGGRNFVFTRRVKCSITLETLSAICESARLSLVSGVHGLAGDTRPHAHWNPWGWERLTIEVGCSTSNPGGGYGPRYLTMNSLCTRHVAAEREAARRRAAELDTQARWKLAYLRVAHRALTVEAVVEGIVDAYVLGCIRESRFPPVGDVQ